MLDYSGHCHRQLAAFLCKPAIHPSLNPPVACVADVARHSQPVSQLGAVVGLRVHTLGRTRHRHVDTGAYELGRSQVEVAGEVRGGVAAPRGHVVVDGQGGAKRGGSGQPGSVGTSCCKGRADL